MSEADRNSKGKGSDSFSETEDDPYAVPSQDKYDSNSEFSKSIMDKWVNESEGDKSSEDKYDDNAEFSNAIVDKWMNESEGDEEAKGDINVDTEFSKFIVDKWVNESEDGGDSSADDTKAKQQMKDKNELLKIELEKLGTGGICGLLFVRNFVEGGIVGMMFGGVKGALDWRQLAAHSRGSFGRVVLREATLNGRMLGLWLGTFRASKVFFMRTRGSNDRLNTFLGGFCAGSMYMLHTRSPLQIITSGITSGAIVSVLAEVGGGL
eukprot:CAMPEP_0114425316 /NCGR_PEP_ID=MMETSP0103-20121206/7170_1 /TAXON_ID=37642 ORGANISM="Paraphysomonas imperforata, Strain PA2" /NCGR_SAMPLE_ID=MMETSP0103 /ASSEMBLY_ACC=CAM_ASM_000201 /LENGTH=264 /DNA_ID=CAMNT_0001594143 /DNA_START=24 /DNA_END=818 /DNA_ORIENTATION=-